MEVITTASAWLLLLLALPLLLLLCHGKNDTNAKNRRRLPPGPLAVPLIGNLLWLTHSAADAMQLFRRLHASHGPLVTVRIGSRVHVTIADRRLAQAVLVERGATLVDRPAFASRHLFGLNSSTISTSDYGPRWRRLRRNFVSEVVQPSRVRLFAPARAWVLAALTDKLRQEGGDGGGVRVLDLFQHAMFSMLIVMCFGERLDERAVRDIAAAERELLIYSFNKLDIFAFFPVVTTRLFRHRWQATVAMRQRLMDMYEPLINARRSRRLQEAMASSETTFAHCYVDTLLDMKLPDEANRALTYHEIVALCSELLSAGSDSAATALQWIMAELVKNPAVQDKLHSEIKATCGYDKTEVPEDDVHKMPYLRAVVLEGLRRHPPAHLLLPRAPGEDMEIGGYLIPKGTVVNFMVANIGLDGETWDRPTEFLPERFLEGGEGEAVDVTGTREIRMIPFGAGRRICPGIGIATLHLEYLVANLVRAFEWKEMEGEEVDMAEATEFTVVMKKPLRVRLMPRS